MRFTIASPKGLICDQEIDYIVSSNKDGQLGILKNHLPIVVPISEGYLKTVTNGVEEFYAVSGAILEFSDNIISVIAQEAVYGKTKNEAFVNLEAERLTLKSVLATLNLSVKIFSSTVKTEPDFKLAFVILFE